MKEFIDVVEPLKNEILKAHAKDPSGPAQTSPTQRVVSGITAQHVRPIQTLIVEDNANDRDLMSIELKRMGRFEVDAAESAEEALSKLTNKSYDIVFLDLNLPSAPGTDVLRELHRAHPKTHIVIVTGSLDQWSVEQLREIGSYCGLVHKPLEEAVVDDIYRKHKMGT